MSELTAEDMILSAFIGYPIETVINAYNKCHICGEKSMDYVKTEKRNGRYIAIRECKNHGDKKHTMLVPLDKITGNIMQRYDNGEIVFKEPETALHWEECPKCNGTGRIIKGLVG